MAVSATAFAISVAATVVALVAVSAPAAVVIGGTLYKTATIATAAISLAKAARDVGVLAGAAAVYAESTSQQQRTYSVYFLGDERGVIQYVGRVLDSRFDQRMSYHKLTRKLTLVKRISNLSYIQARGLEEIGMIQCHTLNPENPINNQIHGISENNPLGETYINSAVEYIGNRLENLFLDFLS